MEKIAQNVINKIGIKKGDTLLDFGCGTGTYTIPAANVVGKNGEVTAIDSDENVLYFLKNKAKTCGLKNIKVLQSSIDYSLPFKDKTFDIILLYDVIHHYYFTPETRKLFIGEISRVAKKNAIISIFPAHMNINEFLSEIGKTSLIQTKQFSGQLIHYHKTEQGTVFNFNKNV